MKRERVRYEPPADGNLVLPLYFVSRCYQHVVKSPMSPHEVATRESMPSLEAIRGTA